MPGQPGPADGGPTGGGSSAVCPRRVGAAAWPLAGPLGRRPCRRRQLQQCCPGRQRCRLLLRGALTAAARRRRGQRLHQLRCRGRGGGVLPGGGGGGARSATLQPAATTGRQRRRCHWLRRLLQPVHRRPAGPDGLGEPRRRPPRCLLRPAAAAAAPGQAAAHAPLQSRALAAVDLRGSGSPGDDCSHPLGPPQGAGGAGSPARPPQLGVEGASRSHHLPGSLHGRQRQHVSDGHDGHPPSQQRLCWRWSRPAQPAQAGLRNPAGPGPRRGLRHCRLLLHGAMCCHSGRVAVAGRGRHRRRPPTLLHHQP
mmetsp:Transcript_21020/g.58289  ORF Transcript_21020/g.58289 Transcript_21020/m.58289 type:complete len:310 (+) Transcript_21020:797-1726(+)